ncbi:putative SKI2-antiviral protein and putative helicase [Violaceomyces palustris]|uniref:SKI2-antiviral protein and putative helicase n=1 Tax=Violaceomyces palustris TaxID=1673888 RepID=A0ACD0NVS4_9BASI|nr:putative SKI2-antiviral protein and putative helicase [Violaceomyces palustris]
MSSSKAKADMASENFTRRGVKGLKHPRGPGEILLGIFRSSNLIAESDSVDGAEGWSKPENKLASKFLTPNNGPGQDWHAKYQVKWPRKPLLSDMLWSAPSESVTKLEFVRSGLEGNVTGYREVSNSTTGIRDSRTSSSLFRSPASSSSFVRGKSGFVPFAPGGLEDEVMKDNFENGRMEGGSKEHPDDIVQGMEEALVHGKGLKMSAPGLTRGYSSQRSSVEAGAASFIPLDYSQEEAQRGMTALPLYRRQEVRSKRRSEEAAYPAQDVVGDMVAELDELLPADRPNPVSGRRVVSMDTKRDWAHVVDVNQSLSNFNELVPEMAHRYPFELDNFQKEAVYHLEQGESVFVAAHTSAGKTVVAEYAIALAQKHMTRCIYTSPIKALSNQKYRDFKETFGAQNVGILTGDVQINPEAPCLIMTTEILRSMLYRGADLIRDVEFVIFDEVHYVNDQERGVVWEEVIILCPQHISLILLSATVPNTKEFADWVGRTKKKDIFVISTPKRPVPLEHFLYAGKDLFKIVDASSQFLGNGIKDASEALRRRQDKEREASGVSPASRGGRGGGRGAGANSRGGSRGMAPSTRGGAMSGRGRGGFAGNSGRGDKNLWVHLVGLLRKKDLLPAVVFVFSKRRCEDYASSMPNTDLCTAREKSEIHIAIEKSLTRLKGSDKNLPQIQRMRDLLSRGVGVHHGGLLPIVKEVVEILFQRGLVKVLFATETFAMGVNMPARCVVFSGIRKHDGHEFRDLLAGEYTQMSGRAGRRGLDATGVVIINASDSIPETPTLHKMLLGQSTKLQSQFRLTYNMILNLLRVEALKVEEMIKRSFSENASQKLLPDQQKKVEQIEMKLARLPKLSSKAQEEKLDLYYDLSNAALASSQGLIELALNHQQGSKNFTPGRVVVLRDHHFDQDLGVIVKLVARNEFLVLASVSPERKSGSLDVDEAAMPPRWPPELQASANPNHSTYDLREVPISSIMLVTDKIIKIDVPLILAHRISAMSRAAQELVDSLQEFLSKGPKVPEADWSKIKRLDFQEALRTRNEKSSRLNQIESPRDDPDFQREYSITHSRKRLQQEADHLRLKLSDQNLELLPDYEQRIEVLKALRFIDPINESVLLKGRVACEINSANELILTELILDNTLVNYKPEEVVALLSIFIFQEKTDMLPELSPRLSEGYSAMLAIADRVSAVQAANQVNYEDFANTSKLGLVEVVYEWARGMPFEQITNLTDVPEGTIVRVITRLDETCREVRDAARVIGDSDLFTKMEECQNLIRRDIVFAASLYF